MTTDFPKDPKRIGRDIAPGLKFNKDKQGDKPSQQEAKSSEQEKAPVLPNLKSLPADEVLNHLAATAINQRSILQHEASLRGFSNLLRVVEDVISKEFPAHNMSRGAQQRLALGVINRLMDAQ